MTKKELDSRLLHLKGKMVDDLNEERKEWNDYLQGEGPWAGHEHSLHESQAAKFKLMEQKIEEVERLLEQDHVAMYVEAIVNGDNQNFYISYCDSPEYQDGKVQKISPDSPVGSVLLEIEEGNTIEVETPGGVVEITLILRNRV